MHDIIIEVFFVIFRSLWTFFVLVNAEFRKKTLPESRNDFVLFLFFIDILHLYKCTVESAKMKYLAQTIIDLYITQRTPVRNFKIERPVGYKIAKKWTQN